MLYYCKATWFLGGKCNYFDYTAIKHAKCNLFFSLSLSGQPAAKHVIKWSQGQNEFHTEVGALLRFWEADKTFSPNDTPLAAQGSSRMDTGSAVLIMGFRRSCCSHPPGNWTGVLWADESRHSRWRGRRWAKCYAARAFAWGRSRGGWGLCPPRNCLRDCLCFLYVILWAPLNKDSCYSPASSCCCCCCFYKMRAE